MNSLIFELQEKVVPQQCLKTKLRTQFRDNEFSAI